MKILITVMLMFCMILSTYAHRVIVFGYVEGHTVFTESSYPDGKPVKGGNIRVFSTDDKLLVEGKTDADGEFSFKVPPDPLKTKSGLRIVLYAGEGHKETWTLSYEDISNKHGGPGHASGDTLSNTPPKPASYAEKIILGLAGIGAFFAVLYYIKRKLKL